jgi:hypothetical protein
MHRIARSIVALVASLVLLSLLAGVALAGGWAQVVVINGAGDPPIAGEPLEYRFKLLQHGVTPVDFGRVQLTATPAGGGDEIVVQATSAGDGGWVARLTLPSDGEWQMRVVHPDLETGAVPPLNVGTTTVAVSTEAVTSTLPLLLALAAMGVMTLAGLTGLVMARAAHRTDPTVEIPANG